MPDDALDSTGKKLAVALVRAAGLALLLLLCPAVAWPGSAVIQGQFTLGPGYTAYFNESCVYPNQWFTLDPNTSGIQCVTIPGIIVGFVGSSSVKTSGVEVLVHIACTNGVLWTHYQQQGTLPVSGSGLEGAGLSGRCWLSVYGNTPSAVPGVYEIQLTIFYR